MLQSYPIIYFKSANTFIEVANEGAVRGILELAAKAALDFDSDGFEWILSVVAEAIHAASPQASASGAFHLFIFSSFLSTTLQEILVFIVSMI